MQGFRSGAMRRRATRVFTAAVVVAGAVAVAAPALTTTSAGASGLLPSNTDVSITPASSNVGNAVTVKATVTVLGLPGLGLTPSGTVTFSYSDGVSNSVIGTGTIKGCLLVTCSTSITTSSLPAGIGVVSASFPGDLLAAGSQGSGAVTIAGNSGQSALTNCTNTTSCDSGTVTSSDGGTTLDVVANSDSSENDQVSGSLSTKIHLHCPGETDAAPTATATFSSTSPDATKTVSYTGVGSNGTAMQAAYANHTTYAGCYAASTPFNGYINGTYQQAQQVTESFGTFYEAQLSNCANNSGARPCFTNINGLGTTNPYDTYEVHTAAGDPHTSG
jgi:hypothetical protein